MKSLTKFLAVAALFAAVTVHAQTPAPGPGADAPPAVSPAATLSIPQMNERVALLKVELADDVARIRQLHEVARKEKDVVKLTCVNDKLVQLKAQQNIHDSTALQFEVAAGADNKDGARISFDSLVATSNDIERLRGETEACIGVPDLYKQESDVDVSHPDFPDDPTTDDPFDSTVEIVEPPAYASPFG